MSNLTEVILKIAKRDPQIRDLLEKELTKVAASEDIDLDDLDTFIAEAAIAGIEKAFKSKIDPAWGFSAKDVKLGQFSGLGKEVKFSVKVKSEDRKYSVAFKGK